MNDGDKGVYRWASTAAAATLAASPALFARCGQVMGTGVNTAVYFAGSADDGPIEKFTTTDGVNFMLAETIPNATARAKSGFAVKADGTAVWSIGDVRWQRVGGRRHHFCGECRRCWFRPDVL